jgi:hypothetical protein
MNSYLTEEEITSLQSSGLKRESPFLITNVSITQFSIARHYGGCTAYGKHYTYCNPTDELIRDDVLKWIGKERKRENSEMKNNKELKQGRLF